MVESDLPARPRRCVSAGRTCRRVLGAAGLAGLVGAACALPGAGGRPAAGGALEGQKNAVMEAWAHSDNRYPWQQKALEDYNKEKGSGVTINWTRVGSAGEVADKLVVTLAAGSGFPDLCDIEISQIGKLLKTTPPFVPFNDALRGRQNDFFLPSFVDPWSDQGKWYSLGNELNAVLFAYRWDVFERAGIKPPLRTWEEMADAGKRLAPHAPHGLMFFGSGTTGPTHILPIIAGGGYLDKNSRLIVNHPANQRALQFLVDLVQRHKAATLESDLSSQERDAAYNAGTVGGDVGPSWRIASLSRKQNAPDSNGKWMVQHLPQPSGTGKTTTTWGGTGMTVLKDSRFKEVGLDFVVWEHSTKAVMYDYDLRQVYPTYKRVYDDPRLNEPAAWFNNQRVGPLLKEAAEEMLPFYQGKWWPEISRGAGKHITAALKGEKPVKQALDDAQNDAKAEIEAAGGRVEPDGTIR